MSKTQTTESSPVNVEDLFYSTEDTPEPDSTPGHEGDTSSSAETDEVEETAPASEAGDTDTEEHDAPTPRSNAQKRIQELLAENKRLKQSQPRVETPKVETPKLETKVEEAKEPTPGEFETWDAYQKAHRDFLKQQIDAQVRDAVERDRKEREQQATAQKQKEQMEQAKTAWDKQVVTTEKRHPDFRQKVFETIEDNGKKFQVLRADIPMNPTLDDFIPKSPVGGEILYHLTTVPAEEAESIRAMQGYDALRHAIQLEAKLTEAIEAPPKKQTLRPPRQVNGSGIAPVQKTAEETFYGSD